MLYNEETILKAASGEIKKKLDSIFQQNPKASAEKLLSKIILQSPAIGLMTSEAINKQVTKLINEKKHRSSTNHDVSSAEASPVAKKKRFRQILSSPEDEAENEPELSLPFNLQTPKSSKNAQNVQFTPIAKRLKKHPRQKSSKN